MSYLTLHHFGLPQNVFARTLDTVDQGNVAVNVKGAIQNNNYAVVTGPRGAGKSSAVAAAIASLQTELAEQAKGKSAKPQIQLIEPLTLDRERMRINAIVDSIIYDLSNESLKATAEARIRQIRPILGEAAGKGPVVLKLEEAHRLHHSTIRALKSLMELKWLGRGPLLSIILVGQKDPTTHPTMEEVGKRAKDGRIRMAGLSEAEAAAYIQGTVGSVWTEEAVAAIAATPAARNYLDLQEALIAAMDQALAEGRKIVELSDVFEATGAGLAEMAKKLNVPLSDIGKAIGKSPSQALRIMTGEREDLDAKARIQAMLAKRAKGGEPAEEPAQKVANG